MIWEVKGIFAVIQGGHRTTGWFGLGSTLKIILFHPPAMGKDVTHRAAHSEPIQPVLSTAGPLEGWGMLGREAQGEEGWSCRSEPLESVNCYPALAASNPFWVETS